MGELTDSERIDRLERTLDIICDKILSPEQHACLAAHLQQDEPEALDSDGTTTETAGENTEPPSE